MPASVTREHPLSAIALLLADSRLPSGAYAHSAGFEAAVQAGATLADVPGYLRARLATVASTDAAAAVLAARIAAGAEAVAGAEAGAEAHADIADAGAAFAELSRAIAARTPSAPMRAASRLLGRGLLRLGLRLAPHSTALGILARTREPFRPVVLGALVSALGGQPADAATVVCYEEAQSVASAALKLLPTDPFSSAEWIVDLQPAIDAVVDRALTVTGPGDLPALGAPRIEMWTQRHATERRRLFVS